MNKWIITVGGYGSFVFEGTEEEAEEMRCHKAAWESGVGRKHLVLENAEYGATTEQPK